MTRERTDGRVMKLTDQLIEGGFRSVGPLGQVLTVLLVLLVLPVVVPDVFWSPVCGH